MKEIIVQAGKPGDNPRVQYITFEEGDENALQEYCKENDIPMEHFKNSHGNIIIIKGKKSFPENVEEYYNFRSMGYSYKNNPVLCLIIEDMVYMNSGSAKKFVDILQMYIPHLCLCRGKVEVKDDVDDFDSLESLVIGDLEEILKTQPNPETDRILSIFSQTGELLRNIKFPGCISKVPII